MTTHHLLLPLALCALVTAACGTAASDGPDVASAPTDAPASSAPVVAGMCAEGELDCQDMVEVPPSALPDGGAAGACLAGATECADIPSADPAAPPEGMEPMMVEPRDGLVDVTPIPWVSIEPNADQTALDVSWWGGNPECFGLDHVEVDEADDAVTITVFTGREADVEVCTEEAVLLATTVELSGELGPRSILDGATTS